MYRCVWRGVYVISVRSLMWVGPFLVTFSFFFLSGIGTFGLSSMEMGKRVREGSKRGKEFKMWGINRSAKCLFSPLCFHFQGQVCFSLSSLFEMAMKCQNFAWKRVERWREGVSERWRWGKIEFPYFFPLLFLSFRLRYLNFRVWILLTWMKGKEK